MESKAKIAALEAKVAELEARLAQQDNHLELLEHAPICIQVFDQEGFSRYMNIAQEAFLGIPDRSVTYGQFNVLTDPGVKAFGMLEPYQKAYSGEIVRIPEWQVPLADFDESWQTSQRRAWMEQLIYPIKEGGKVNSVVSFHWDITQRKEMEVALITAQRHEGLALLAGGIAHDFNNLLTGILGNASLGRLDAPNVSSMTICLEEIQSSAEQAADLTRQLLAYSGKGRFLVREILLSEVVGQMPQLLRLALPEKAVIRIDTEADEPIRADVAQLRQVVMNLITNAGDALGPQGGTITIHTSFVNADESYLAQTFSDPDLAPGPYMCLEVSDDGQGMDEETRLQMFDPFFTTKKKGHGLGLAATLGIIKGHKGAIRVYSELGKGTTIKLLFPVCEGAEIRPASAQPIYSHESTQTILVVDDDSKIRNFIRRALEQTHHRVILATNGREGLETFRQRHQEIDMVIMDLTMPEMNGADAFREMRRIHPEVQVLLMSGYNAQDTTNKFAGKGLAGFIQKPFSADALRNKLAALSS